MIELANHSFEITQDAIKNYNKVVVAFNNLENNLKYKSKDWTDQLSIIWFTNEYLSSTTTNKYASGQNTYLSAREFQDYLNKIQIGGGSVDCPSDCSGYCGSYTPCSSDCSSDCGDCGCDDSCDCGDCNDCSSDYFGCTSDDDCSSDVCDVCGGDCGSGDSCDYCSSDGGWS